MDSVKNGHNTSCTISLRSINMAHASSPSGTLPPTWNGNNLNKVEFSWPFPQTLSVAAKFFGITCGLSSLSEYWYGNLRICVLRYSRVKYLRRLISQTHKANSTSTIPSNRTWSISGGKQVMGWKCCNALLRAHSPVTPKWVAFSPWTTFCTWRSWQTFVLMLTSASETSRDCIWSAVQQQNLQTYRAWKHCTKPARPWAAK